ncbi:MAG TPA: polyprenyl synthetase family protein [Streptosporangiaceae bacterium]|jgi:geranylgeranyl diphosphate synthase type I|nr:polyprenyl synthetase family protein [Streptosporangiaceae bacterium]
MSVDVCRDVGVQAAADVTFVTGELRPYLAELLAREQTAWKEQGAPWRDPPEALAAYLDGGKALRPRFCFWGHAIAGPGTGTVLVQACAALELLHAFALIHDDLMDDSDTRRGRPALHRQVAGQHRRHGWTGDPDSYGRAMALLVGDLAFAVASRLAAALPGPALMVWRRMVDELVLGQFLDLAGAARQDRSLEVARTTALLKSGQYTVTGPLRLGAALTGAPQLPPGLARYGDLVGEAFQLRDDLLGVFGDQQRTGKPVGEDLACGKPTQLLAYAADMLPPRGQALLALAGTPALTREDRAELTGELIRCGARDRVEQKVRRNVRAACALVDRAALPPRVAAALHELAMTAADRQR